MDAMLSYLHKDDSVDGYCAPFAEVPCFLPVVPRITSCKPDLFQQIEYLGIADFDPSHALLCKNYFQRDDVELRKEQYDHQPKDFTRHEA